MARMCLVCNSSKRKQIDAAVIGATASRRAIAGQHGVSKSSLDRHVTVCLPVKLTAALKEEGHTLASRAREMRAIVQSVLDKLAETGGEESPMQALSSGLLAMKLKAVDSLGKLAELEFGTKSKVTTTVDPRQEWAALAPTEKRERLAEMKHRLLELERETGGERETRQ